MLELLTKKIAWRITAILLIGLMVFNNNTNAQLTGDNYPVQSHVYVNGAGTRKVSELFTSSTKLSVDLILKDLTKTTLPVYLEWQLEGIGLGVQVGSTPGFVPSQNITLQKGRINTLKGIDLREYFQPGVVDVAGVSESVVFNGSLPEGFYVIRVRAYEAGTGRIVSNRAETFFSIAYALPPIINLPFAGSEVPVTRPQNVLLQWTPRHTRTPGSSVLYNVTVCPVAEDEEPYAAMNSRADCFQLPPQTSTTYNLSAADLPLQMGQRYAVQVQAEDLNQSLEFQNEGYSQTTWFRYGKQCTAPERLSINEVGPGRVNVSWQANEQALGYIFEYRPESETDWTALTTLGTSSNIYDLKPDETYLFRVATTCAVGYDSPFSEEATYEVYGIDPEDEELDDLIYDVLNPLKKRVSTTDEPETTDDDNLTDPKSGKPTDNPVIATLTDPDAPLPTKLADLLDDPTKIPCVGQISTYENCDVATSVDLPTGTETLDVLAVGDYLTVADYAVVITEMGVGNPLSGKGLARLPFMNDVFVGVEFSGVSAIKDETKPENGGCVNEVPANGFFRVRNMTQAELEAEEQILINTIRESIEPGSTLKTLDELITDYTETGTEIKTKVANGNPLTEADITSIVAETEKVISSLTNWKMSIAELNEATKIPSLSVVPSLVESLIERLRENTSDLISDPANTEAPLNIKNEVEALTDIIKRLIEDSKIPDQPKISNLVALANDDKSAKISWKGDPKFTHYMVSYKAPGIGELLLRTESPTANLPNLINGLAYEIQVTGYTDQGYKDFKSVGLETKEKVLPFIGVTSEDFEINGNYKIAWNGNPLYERYVLKYTDKNGLVRTIYTSQYEVSLNELDLGQDYTYTLAGYTKDGSKSNVVQGNFKVKADCTFLSEIIVGGGREKFFFGETITLRVSRISSLACQSTLEWYDAEDNRIGTGPQISLTLDDEMYNTITVKCDQLLSSTGGIQNGCSVTRNFDIISNRCEVSTVKVSSSDVFEGEEVLLSISGSGSASGCLNGNNSYWIKDGVVIGQGDRIYVKPKAGDTTPYYAVCEDGDKKCQVEARPINVQPLCNAMELTFPRFSDEYLIVHATNCEEVETWSWTDNKVDQVKLDKRNSLTLKYLIGLKDQTNAIMLKHKKSSTFTITATCKQGNNCFASKTFDENSECTNGDCTTFPIVTPIGNNLYEVRLVVSRDTDPYFALINDFNKSRFFPPFRDLVYRKFVEERAENTCSGQIPSFSWPDLDKTGDYQIVEATDKQQLITIQKELRRYVLDSNGNRIPIFSNPGEWVPVEGEIPVIEYRTEVSQTCSQPLEVVIPKRDDSNKEAEFELKIVELPNGDEYIFPTGCQNQWEEGTIVIEMPLPVLNNAPGAVYTPFPNETIVTNSVTGKRYRQLIINNGDAIPFRVLDRPWFFRATCELSNSITTLAYNGNLDPDMAILNALIWTATAATLVTAYNSAAPQSGSGIPAPLIEWKNKLDVTSIIDLEADIQLPVRALINFYKNNTKTYFNPTEIDFSDTEGNKKGPEKYQTTNVVNRVIEDLCNKMSSASLSTADKIDVLCKLQNRFKEAGHPMRELDETAIQQFADGNCNTVVSRWKSDAPISKEVAEKILAGNKDLITRAGTEECETERATENLQVIAQVKTEPDCNGQKGKVEISVTGGTPPYQYKLASSAGWQRSYQFLDLAPGNYTFQAKDSEGNKGNRKVSLGSELQITVIVSSESETCSAKDGKITVEASGGCPTLKYSKDNGATWQGSNVFENLAAGKYEVKVQDKAGTEVTRQANIENRCDPPPSIREYEDYEPPVLSVTTPTLGKLTAPNARRAATTEGEIPYYISPDGKAIQLPAGARPKYFNFGGSWGIPPKGTLEGFVLPDGTTYFAEIIGYTNAKLKGYRKYSPSDPAEYFDLETITVDDPGGHPGIFLEDWKDDKGNCGPIEKAFEYSFTPSIDGLLIEITPEPTDDETEEIYRGEWLDKTKCEDNRDLVAEGQLKVNADGLDPEKLKQLQDLLDRLNAEFGDKLKRLKLSIAVVKPEDEEKMQEEAKEEGLIQKQKFEFDGSYVFTFFSDDGTGFGDCGDNYINEKLKDLQSTASFNNSAEWDKALTTTLAYIYHGFIGSLKCQVAKDNFYNCPDNDNPTACTLITPDTEAQAFAAGFASSFIEDIDIVTQVEDLAGILIKMATEIPQGVVESYYKYPGELLELYTKLKETQNTEELLTKENILKAIPPPKPSGEQLDFIGNVGSFMWKNYVTDANYWTSGELTAMVAPIVLTAGAYLGKKVISLSGRVAKVFAGGSDELVSFFKAGKKLEYADIALEAGDDIKQVVKREKDDAIENIYEESSPRSGDYVKICGSCLAQNTAVFGTNATLENLQPLTTVQTLEEDGSIGKRNVWGKVGRKVSEYVKIFVGKDELQSSTEHEFKTSEGWKPANYLRKGMMLFSLALNSFVPIDSMATVHEPLVVEGLSLGNVQGYGVGSLGVVTAQSPTCVLGLSGNTHEKILNKLGDSFLQEIQGKTDLINAIENLGIKLDGFLDEIGNSPVFKQRTLQNSDYVRAFKEYDPNKVYLVNGRIPINSGGSLPKILKTSGGVDITFDTNGFPDFTDHVVLINKKKQLYEIDMQGNYSSDFSIPDAKAGITEKYRIDNKLTWHHHQDGRTMMLVPRDINGGIRHTGGKSITDHNNAFPNNVLYFPSPKIN